MRTNLIELLSKLDRLQQQYQDEPEGEGDNGTDTWGDDFGDEDDSGDWAGGHDYVHARDHGSDHYDRFERSIHNTFDTLFERATERDEQTSKELGYLKNFLIDKEKEYKERIENFDSQSLWQIISDFEFRQPEDERSAMSKYNDLNRFAYILDRITPDVLTFGSFKGVKSLARNFTHLAELDRLKGGAFVKKIDGDKIFHCMATCEGTKAGIGGQLTVSTITTVWEEAQILSLKKGGVLSSVIRPTESLEASRRDMIANSWGIEGGSSTRSCMDHCMIDWKSKWNK